MAIDMKGILEIIIKMEKESIIMHTAIYMKAILKAIKEKEKQFIIMQMVIEEWMIIQMVGL